MTGRNIYLFSAQCSFSCTYIFCMCTMSPLLVGTSCLGFRRRRSFWMPMATTLMLWLLLLCLNRSLLKAQVVHVVTYTIYTVWESTHIKVQCRSAQAQTHTALGPFLLTIRPIKHIKINQFLQLCTAVQPSISRSKQKHPLRWKYETSFLSRSTNCTQEGVTKPCLSSDLYSALHTFDSPFCRRCFQPLIALYCYGQTISKQFFLSVMRA